MIVIGDRGRWLPPGVLRAPPDLMEFVKAGDTHHPGLFKEIGRVAAQGPPPHRFEMRRFKSDPVEPIVIETETSSLAALFADEEEVPVRPHDDAKTGPA